MKIDVRNMIIHPIKHTHNNFESTLEDNIDEASNFFKNEGMIYEIALKNGHPPKQFRDVLREYIRLKFGDKCEEVIKHIPRMIIKYDSLFEDGKKAYQKY